MHASSRFTRRLAALALAVIAAACAAPVAAGVTTALTPASRQVAPDSTFTVDLEVTTAGSAFNAFTAVIEYDPGVLTFLPGAPIGSQQGCLLTGACSAACGLTYHTFAAAGDSLVIHASLLCDQTTLTGPGQLYRLRFRAPNAPASTWVRVRRLQFYDAGLFVTPATSADAFVDVIVGLGVGPNASPARLRLEAAPNPARGAIALAITGADAGAQRVDVLDAAGRLVRRLDDAHALPGTRTLRWDGTDAAGARLPAGMYLVRVTRGTHTAQSRVVLLR